ncbi:hypothetical protein [Ideonella sp. BN130291]|uniref:hypothetical protein n=1 Tax=Ideonella sp. BN130291 TaxID=3112940 RepID=UPI002E253CAA|nr:hypothetical protein [Ideonella sp. BN130291]
MNEFDGDHRKYQALMDYVAFKELHEFVSNSAAIAAHTDSYAVSSLGPIAASKVVELKVAKAGELRGALMHFACQTIVSLCTTFEVAARDFLQAVFAVKPDGMFEFLGPEDARGHVPLKDVLQASSHDELVGALAKRAAGSASKGKYGAVFARATQLAGGTVDKAIVSRLNSLQTERNKLVHERHRPAIGLEEVLNAHATVDAAIDALCEIAVKAGMPGRYTCVHSDAAWVVQDVVGLVPGDAP